MDNYPDLSIAAKLNLILRKLDALTSTVQIATSTIITKETHIMADLTDLTAAVTNATAVDESAITLINGIAAQLAAAGTDPVALADLASSLNTESASLAAAVAANTPAAPPAP